MVAFSYVLPITVAMLAVLGLLILSYRQTIKAYPSAGGAYIVTKDNLGVLPAQVAGVALLTDYILTVSVSVSAGVAALYSVFGGLYPYRVPIAVGFIAIIAFGNLRGVKESGKIFAVPTYLFILAMFLMIGYGIYKATLGGGLHFIPLDPEQIHELAGVEAVGWFLVLHAFASGGAAVTGVEAISNGVPAFKEPSWKNASQTLVIMGATLGVMFFGISWLATQLHPVPEQGKTVIAQIAEAVYGTSGLGHVLFIFTQAATMFILVLAANTSFADFPRLASFQAEDSFMPRQLTKRGHRLVFSNGIIALSISAAVLVILLGADVTKLIPLYAVGVFTSFTLSQLGMARRHLRLREPGWRLGLGINGLGAIVTAVVTIVIASTKFLEGAWVIIVLIPILVWVVVRLNHQYEAEKSELQGDALRGGRGPDPAPPHRAGAHRQDRPHRRPGHPVRPHPDAGRPPGGAHRRRRGPRRGARRRVEPPGAQPPAPRDPRVPRSPHQPVGARAGRRGGGRRADRGHHPHPPPRVPLGLAPAAARPHRRLHRQGHRRRPPRQRHLRARTTSPSRPGASTSTRSSTARCRVRRGQGQRPRPGRRTAPHGDGGAH